MCNSGKVSRKRSACKFKGQDVIDRLCGPEEGRIQEDNCTGICSPSFQLYCPSYKDNLCCQGNGTCQEMQGPCKIDSDCKGSLICGMENCDWAKGINCCKKDDISGKRTNDLSTTLLHINSLLRSIRQCATLCNIYVHRIMPEDRYKGRV